jgi:hypothetical protein
VFDSPLCHIFLPFLRPYLGDSQTTLVLGRRQGHVSADIMILTATNELLVFGSC